MTNKSEILIKSILLGLAVCFGFLVLFKIYSIYKEETRKSEDIARRAVDPVYKAEEEEKEARAEIYKSVVKSMEASDKSDRERLVRERENDESNRKEAKKILDAAYKEQVDRDAEKMLAVEKYMKDVAEAADRKR